MKVVVVGYGPGGATAASAAKMFDKSSEVIILTSETSDAHRKPGAAMAFSSPDTEDLVIRDWSFDTLKKRGIQVISGVNVVAGSVKDRILKYRDLKGNEKEISFDRLILATGGTPRLPNIPGIDLPEVYTIQDMPDASVLGANMDSIKKAVVVGAGFSGLEVAEKLHELGKEVHLIVRSRLMRRLLEPPMSEELQNRISKYITLHIGKSPSEVIGSEKAEGIKVDDTVISADAIIFMTGVLPKVDLANELGLKIGTTGGISVSPKMETSIKDVYAVGDCVEMVDPLTNEPILMPIGSTAARAGRQAGVAAVGGKKVYADLTLRLQYDRIFNTDIVCVGHSSVTAGKIDFNPNVKYIEDSAEFSKVALITDKSGHLIGGQIISSRMGARVGYQIYNKVLSGAKLKDSPLLESTHERLKDLIESMFGPIQ